MPKLEKKIVIKVLQSKIFNQVPDRVATSSLAQPMSCLNTNQREVRFVFIFEKRRDSSSHHTSLPERRLVGLFSCCC